MGFWIFMAVMTLGIPLAMIVIGNIFINKLPKHINSIYGYRTVMSMKNKETWEFAHRCCGKIWRISGLILLILSLAPMIYVRGQDARTIGTVGGVVVTLQITAMFCSIIPVERALKKNFDEDGVCR